MRDLNQVTLLGNVGRDPEVKYLQSGTAVVNITVATNERWKDKESGELKEKTEWHNVVAFDKTAEFIGKYTKKGSRVLVQGQIQTRKWQDKEGADRYTTEIKALSVDSQDRRGEESEPEQEVKPVRRAAPARPAARPDTRNVVRARPTAKPTRQVESEDGDEGEEPWVY